MKRALGFNEFTPVPGPYESGAAFATKEQAQGVCDAINRISEGWTVEELKAGAATWWRVVWLGSK
jgi:hypothetical protein